MDKILILRWMSFFFFFHLSQNMDTRTNNPKKISFHFHGQTLQPQLLQRSKRTNNFFTHTLSYSKHILFLSLRNCHVISPALSNHRLPFQTRFVSLSFNFFIFYFLCRSLGELFYTVYTGPTLSLSSYCVYTLFLSPKPTVCFLEFSSSYKINPKFPNPNFLSP